MVIKQVVLIVVVVVVVENKEMMEKLLMVKVDKYFEVEDEKEVWQRL